MYTLDDTESDEIDEAKLDKAIIDQIFADGSDLVKQLVTNGVVKGKVIIDGIEVDYTLTVDTDRDDENEDDDEWDANEDDDDPDD